MYKFVTPCFIAVNIRYHYAEKEKYQVFHAHNVQAL